MGSFFVQQPGDECRIPVRTLEMWDHVTSRSVAEDFVSTGALVGLR
jgi:hypothetical protein